MVELVSKCFTPGSVTMFMWQRTVYARTGVQVLDSKLNISAISCSIDPKFSGKMRVKKQNTSVNVHGKTPGVKKVMFHTTYNTIFYWIQFCNKSIWCDTKQLREFLPDSPKRLRANDLGCAEALCKFSLQNTKYRKVCLTVFKKAL